MAEIKIRCPSCEALLKLPALPPGTPAVRCPSCEEAIPVNASSAFGNRGGGRTDTENSPRGNARSTPIPSARLAPRAESRPAPREESRSTPRPIARPADRPAARPVARSEARSSPRAEVPAHDYLPSQEDDTESMPLRSGRPKRTGGSSDTHLWIGLGAIAVLGLVVILLLVGPGRRWLLSMMGGRGEVEAYLPKEWGMAVSFRFADFIQAPVVANTPGFQKEIENGIPLPHSKGKLDPRDIKEIILLREHGDMYFVFLFSRDFDIAELVGKAQPVETYEGKPIYQATSYYVMYPNRRTWLAMNSLDGLRRAITRAKDGNTNTLRLASNNTLNFKLRDASKSGIPVGGMRLTPGMDITKIPSITGSLNVGRTIQGKISLEFDTWDDARKGAADFNRDRARFFDQAPLQMQQMPAFHKLKAALNQDAVAFASVVSWQFTLDEECLRLLGEEYKTNTPWNHFMNAPTTMPTPWVDPARPQPQPQSQSQPQPQPQPQSPQPDITHPPFAQGTIPQRPNSASDTRVLHSPEEEIAALQSDFEPHLIVRVEVTGINDEYDCEEFCNLLRPLRDHQSDDTDDFEKRLHRHRMNKMPRWVKGKVTYATTKTQGKYIVLLAPVANPRAFAMRLPSGVEFAVDEAKRVVQAHVIDINKLPVPEPPPLPMLVSKERKLRRQPDEEISRAITWLQRGNVFQRREALEFLARTEPNRRQKQITEILEEIIDGDDWGDQDKAAEALAVWGTEESLPVLKRSLHRSRSFFKESVVGALEKIGTVEAAEALAGVLENDSFNVASNGLKRMGSIAAPFVRKYVRSTNSSTSNRAVDILKHIGTLDCIPTLQAKLREEVHWPEEIRLAIQHIRYRAQNPSKEETKVETDE